MSKSIFRNVTGAIALMYAAGTVNAQAQSPLSAIHGSAKDSAGQPVAGVEVTIHNLDDQSDPAVLSAFDGSFALRKIKPGKYEISATHDGFQVVRMSFALAAGEDRPLEIMLSSAVVAPAVTQPVTNVAPGGFWKRFAQAYKDDWHSAPTIISSPAPGAEPAYRGYPPVVSNPPFPFTVWPMGGTVWIGYNNATQYPLTTALQTGPHGEWWKKANIQIYGWGDLGMNLSTSSARPTGTRLQLMPRYPIPFNSISLPCTSSARPTPFRPTTSLGIPGDRPVWP